LLWPAGSPGVTVPGEPGWRAAASLRRAPPRQELLEHSDSSIEQIATECGLTPLMLRRHFARRYETTPQAYRRTFGQAR
jgi:transcriptional regulator GlxA family with amidase domain